MNTGAAGPFLSDVGSTGVVGPVGFTGAAGPTGPTGPPGVYLPLNFGENNYQERHACIVFQGPQIGVHSFDGANGLPTMMLRGWVKISLFKQLSGSVNGLVEDGFTLVHLVTPYVLSTKALDRKPWQARMTLDEIFAFVHGWLLEANLSFCQFTVNGMGSLSSRHKEFYTQVRDPCGPSCKFEDTMNDEVMRLVSVNYLWNNLLVTHDEFQRQRQTQYESLCTLTEIPGVLMNLCLDYLYAIPQVRNRLYETPDTLRKLLGLTDKQILQFMFQEQGIIVETDDTQFTVY